MQDLARRLRSTVFVALLAGAAAHAEPPLDGIPDAAFGQGGLALASFDATADFSDRAEGMAISPSGRIYVAATVGVVSQGVTRTRFGLARFFADGQLDPAFSSDGLASPAPAVLAAQNLWARGVLVRADGKPVVYGYRFPGGGAAQRMLVCRYAVAGNLDASFDTDGCAEPALALIDNGEETIRTAIRLADERMLLGGLVDVDPVNPDRSDAVVVMLDAEGAIVGSFGTAGYRRLQPPGSTYAFVSDLHPLADGRFIVVGTSELGMFAARLNADGSLDTGFGANGYAQVTFDDLHSLQFTLDLATAGAVDTQGRVYLCGRINYGNNSLQSVMAFARLTAGGVLDVGYSEDGRVLRPFIDVYPTSNVADCAIDVAGRLVAAVHTGTVNPTNGDFGVLRMLADGSADLRFNTIGQTHVPVNIGGNGVGDARATSLSLVGDRILVAGTAYPGDGSASSGERLVLTRLGSDRTFADGFEGN